MTCGAGAGLVACAAMLAGACARSVATTSEVDAFRTRAGALAAAETSAAAPRGRYSMHGVRLVGSTGLTAVGRLLVPARGPGCYPAVLLQNGREENSAVIGRLPAEFGDVVVMSLDYPAALPMSMQLSDVLFDRGRVRRAAGQIPAQFLLGVEYLARRRDVDSSRMALAATSFAVPFATIAGAAEPRFRELALIYGAGDLPAVLAANLTTKPRALRRPLAWLATRPFASLAPERFIGRVAPRRIVFVNGIDDPQMPAAAVRRLFDAAGQPKSMTWLRTGHLMPTDSALIRALVDTAFAKMPVLHAPADSGRCRVEN